MNKRIFVFGLDGATWKLIDRWLKKGHLPFFKQLIRQGVKRDLISTIPPRTAPAWASFISGLNPGEHGVYDFFIKRDVFGQIKEELVNGRWLGKNKFWKKWEKLGKRVALINLPLGHPVEKVAGVLISSFLTPNGAQFTYPKSLEEKLRDWGYGREEIDFLESYGKNKSRAQIFKEILARLEARVRVINNLLKEEDFDFFFALFRAPDLSQHLFWRGRQTLEVYRKIDGYLSQFYQFLVKKYGARNFYFFIISDHGFHPAPKIQVNLYPWLRKNGFLSSTMKAFLARILRKLSFWEKDKSKSRFNSWAQSKVLLVDNFGIWLNRKVLKKEIKNYRRRLIEKLKTLSYRRRRVFQLVAPREEVYWGRKTRMAPDIVFLPRSYFSIGPSSIERKIFINRTVFLPGTHDSDRRGIFLAKGVGMKRLLKSWEGRDLYLWDLPQIFNRIFGIKDNKIRKINHSKGAKLTKKEEEEIKKRLRALGYL